MKTKLHLSLKTVLLALGLALGLHAAQAQSAQEKSESRDVQVATPVDDGVKGEAAKFNASSDYATAALATKPKVEATRADLDENDMNAWIVKYKTWLDETPGFENILTADELLYVRQGAFQDLYKHLYYANFQSQEKQ